MAFTSHHVSVSKGKAFILSPSEQPQPPPPPLFSHHPIPAPLPLPATFSINSDRAAALKVSPSVLLIIIILAIVFFVSGLLHLLVRFLWRPHPRDPDDVDNVTALQGQLQQLFHLHDAGVDQSFIDTLPVFHYKAIIGLKNPFDCAVCLCEFEAEDKLRLLPKCSHAFHMDCIDTWLLSHSTCPLCRATLLPDFSPTNTTFSPIVLVLESGSDSSREILPEREGTGAVLGRDTSAEFGSIRIVKSGDLSSGDGNLDPNLSSGDGVEKVVTVKLGKFRNVDDCGGGGERSSIATNNVDARRCFSMGSFAYVMDESSSLQVPIRTPMKKQSSNKKCALPLTPGHRPAMSECDCESTRDFRFVAGFGVTRLVDDVAVPGGTSGSDAAIGGNRKESFSVSKIWLRGKEKPNSGPDSSRRAVSFRYANSDEKNGKFETRSCISEIDMGKWENGASEFGFDEENQSCYSMDSQARAPSFARRTLLWLTGRQSKVVHSASASDL